MRIISYRAVRESAEVHQSAGDALDRWYEITEGAEWHSLADVRKHFPACDPVGVDSENTVYVFNVGGNKYRLIAAIHFNRRVLYILRVMTHKGYSKENWKRES